MIIIYSNNRNRLIDYEVFKDTLEFLQKPYNKLQYSFFYDFLTPLFHISEKEWSGCHSADWFIKKSLKLLRILFKL